MDQSITTALDNAMQQCNQHIVEKLSTAGPDIQKVTTHLLQAQGKGVRALTLLACAIDDKGNIPADAPKAAAAIEILHMATLVHDDVMDNASTRRGISTIHHQFDTKTAVICGDLLLAIALSMITDIDTQRLEANKDNPRLAPRITNALAAVCKGEYNQHINNGNLDMSLVTYLRTISGKTAALFFVSAYGGAILAGHHSQAEALRLGRFGRALGMAFQIIDDCKDYTWTDVQAGKPVGNDIKMGVITLPLLIAMGKDKNLRGMAKALVLADKDTADFVKQVQNTGSVEDTLRVAHRFIALAKKSIKDLPAPKRAALEDILGRLPA